MIFIQMILIPIGQHYLRTPRTKGLTCSNCNWEDIIVSLLIPFENFPLSLPFPPLLLTCIGVLESVTYFLLCQMRIIVSMPRDCCLKSELYVLRQCLIYSKHSLHITFYCCYFYDRESEIKPLNCPKEWTSKNCGIMSIFKEAVCVFKQTNDIAVNFIFLASIEVQMN